MGVTALGSRRVKSGAVAHKNRRQNLGSIDVDHIILLFWEIYKHTVFMFFQSGELRHRTKRDSCGANFILRMLSSFLPLFDTYQLFR